MLFELGDLGWVWGGGCGLVWCFGMGGMFCIVCFGGWVVGLVCGLWVWGFVFCGLGCFCVYLGFVRGRWGWCNMGLSLLVGGGWIGLGILVICVWDWLGLMWVGVWVGWCFCIGVSAGDLGVCCWVGLCWVVLGWG